MNNKNNFSAKVSVVIPNYNGQHLLKKFLPSIFSTLKNGDELVIVDDCSSDHSISWLINKFKLKLTKRSFYKREIPKNYNPNLYKLKFKLYENKINIVSKANKTITMLLVSNEVNLRFAATANVGFMMANNPYVLLLNSDVKATENVRAQLLNNFSDNNVFAVGCLEYEKNISGEKSGKNKLWFSKGLFQHSKANNFKSGNTAWVSGGSGMFSREKWLELGGFDKLFYPAYWEDIDISFRARKRGFKILFDEQAIIYHVHESTNMDEFGQKKINDMSWENGQKFTLKNGNLWQKIQYYLFKPYWNYKRSSITQKITS